MIHGRGGRLRPELPAVGRHRRPEQIEKTLPDPGHLRDAQSNRGRGHRAPSERAVTVKLRDAKTIRGIAKNESAFDLQLLGTDQQLHLLRKEQIAEIQREKSLMPKLKTSADERRDLIAYLSSLVPDANAKT